MMFVCILYGAELHLSLNAGLSYSRMSDRHARTLLNLGI